MKRLRKFSSPQHSTGNKIQLVECGLTLLELVIVIAIIMVATGVVLIGTRGSNNDYRTLHNAALMLQADMRYAQRRAVMEGQRVEVRFEPTQNRYHLITLSPTTTLRTVYFQNGVNLRSTTYPGNRMWYLPRATTGPQAGTIVLTNGRYWQELTTTVSGGRVEIKPVLIAGGN